MSTLPKQTRVVVLGGMRNRASVFLQWVWAYVTWERGARIITR